MCKNRIQYKFTTELFIQEANKVHDYKYDYSKVKYTNKRNKVIIICPIHGEYEQLAGAHMYGRGCLKCAAERRIGVFKYNQEYKEELKSWRSMINRCHYSHSKKSHSWKYYISRGIVVCDRWRDTNTGFMYFVQDMGRKPSKEYSIDRIDNNGNYEPGNCRWATSSEQKINSRRKINKHSGIPGVNKTKAGKWKVTLNRDYKELYGGTFQTLEDAILGLEKLKKEYYEGTYRPKRKYKNNSSR